MVIARRARGSGHRRSLYNLVVVVDERLAISHVIAREDHSRQPPPSSCCSNEALGSPPAGVLPSSPASPLILNGEGRNALQARWGHLGGFDFRDRGYKPPRRWSIT